MILSFDKGTLILSNISNEDDAANLPPGFKWDKRTSNFRGPAYLYRRALAHFESAKVSFENRIPENSKQIQFRESPSLFPYQMLACEAWEQAGQRGIIVLPTGGGKTRVAIAMIQKHSLATLILVPTRALMQQWQKALSEFCNQAIGMIGDGLSDIQPITISTFESAYRHMPRIGHQFDLLVVDEAHHFGNGIRDEALLMSIATKRLALTASLPTDVLHLTRLENMVGQVAFERTISDLRGDYLADFEHYKIPVELTSQEFLEYQSSYSYYQKFAERSKWCWQELGWSAFSRYAAQSENGRKALASAARARSIVGLCEKKQIVLKRLLSVHWDQRVFVFVAGTQDVCQIARMFLAYPLTAAIGRAEREAVLHKFREGSVRALVACKVLNEGIDVPEADVAIILGGTGNPREQIQRVGRVLRKSVNKKALIYELIAEKTFEVQKSRRRNKKLDHL